MSSIERSIRLAHLLKQSMERPLTSEETAEIETLRKEDPEHEQWFDQLTQPEAMLDGLQEIRSVDVDRGWARLQAAMAAAQKPRPNRRKQLIMAMAAVLTGTILIAGLFLQLTKDGSLPKPALQAERSIEPIGPGKDRAFLVLADGSRIPLDSAGNGRLAMQGSAEVVKKGALLSYRSATPQTTAVYNTISTPRGGQYRLELPDGSKVWLNAASSLRFPTAFIGKERTVYLEGEAFFDVKTDARKPFRVKVGELTVDATGTQFNINAYPDEAGILTTLSEGRVEVRSGGTMVTLKPAEEVLAHQKGHLTPVRKADLESTLAWTNGKFVFNGADVPAIMRQIGRWYDVDVRYLGPVKGETFTGMVSRQSDISRVLRIMEAGGIKFRIEKNVIMVE